MEFDLIERIRRRIATREDVVLGIGDDAALLQPPAGRQLAVATDTLNFGVHFPAGTAATDVGWKSLAVNLSDLAAMGAAPAWCTLSLCLPRPEAEWVDGFLDGFLDLAGRHRIALVGGDTTRGPLSIGVTVIGLVEPGRALRRDGARIGDDIWVSGSLGDAAGALALMEGGGRGSGFPAALRERLDRPTPRVGLGLATVGIAHAAIDVSDGLLADLGHVCRASRVGAEVWLDALPCSPALAGAFDSLRRRELQATGGDDYELCFTAAPAAAAQLTGAASAAGVAITRIGRMIEGEGVQALDAGGGVWHPPQAGHEHFRS